MVSTDNHLGYLERDPIRGNDSFAAFEEVLLLAKRHNCDMVLLAGDLFHENKPTRQTLFKTMSILRRHTMGPNPVQFQITSNQSLNFRSTTSNTVNYEDPYSCVDLPIFSIHGNHDDPTRDGGSEMLAALDLLAVNHLVNYFGRQDEVDKVVVSPVLIHKGETKVALYGMGSMRDERLNRMWQGKKVRFLKANPDKDANPNANDDGNNSDDKSGDDDDDSDDDDKEENGGWFNIFALHQNRDLGRGSKNCVHESMIPEWMDLVVWGHEHECLIHPSESAVGTFRITQPGSSVATSLTEGESMRKHVGILDIRKTQFRMTAVPLMNVRSFAMGGITLSEERFGLDPEDPRIDEVMRELLTKEVEKLKEQAREDSRLLEKEVNGNGGNGGNGNAGDCDLKKDLHFRVEKPEQVLVRLKVEHSGFSTLHNQRFGSQFVNDVANPSDILLFHRRRTTDASGKKKKKKSKTEKELDANADPIPPMDLDEINIEDIVKDTLGASEKKLQILDEQRLSLAVEDFVSKEQKGTIGETVGKIISGQQKKLVKRGINVGGEDGDGDGSGGGGGAKKKKLSTENAVREAVQAETQRARDDPDQSVDEEEEDDDEEFSTNGSTAKGKGRGRYTAATSRKERAASISDGSDLEVVAAPKRKRTAVATKAKPSKSPPKKRATAAPKKRTNKLYEDSDDEIEEFAAPKVVPKKRAARATATKRKRYADDSEDEIVDDGDDSDIEIVEEAPEKETAARGRAAAKRSKASSSNAEDSEEGFGSGWGTAASSSQKSRRR